MDLSPWLIRRQTYEAVAGGRPDDAHRLIAPLLDGGNWKAWRAAREVVKGYCGRAGKAVDGETPDAAWADLLAAESLNTGERCVAGLRQMLTRFGLVQARAALEAGDPGAAAEVAAKLRDRGVRHADLPPIEHAARDWLAAAVKADRGDFLPALDDLHRLRARLPAPPAGLDRFRGVVTARHERLLDAFARGQEAAGARRWADAVAAADEAIAAAPEYHLARTLRTRAWQAAYPVAVAPSAAAAAAPNAYVVAASRPGTAADADPSHALTGDHFLPPAGGSGDAPPGATLSLDSLGALGVLLAARPGGRPTPAGLSRRPDRDPRVGPNGSSRLGSGAGSGAGFGSAPAADPGADRALPKRFLLWVDGVAGFLVCTGSRVTFGQAVADGGPVDVPLVADVSRVHAEVTRDDEGYLIEAGSGVPAGIKDGHRAVLVNGAPVARAVLAPGDRVTLGATCQFLFRRPVPVSSTARLELTSGHRLKTLVEGVLLMANEVAFGAEAASHVVVPDLPHSILLYRSKDGLGVRVAGGRFAVNGRSCEGRAALPLPASVETDAVTFSVEPVGPRL